MIIKKGKFQSLISITDSNLTNIYESSKELFTQFTRLRWSSHSAKEVEIICTQLSSLYKNTLINKQVELV